MFQRAFVVILLAAIVVLSKPAKADDDRLASAILGQKVTGTADGHDVTADLYEGAVMVFGTDSSCVRDYYVTAANIIKTTTPHDLDACNMVRCENPELIKLCKSKKFKKSETVGCHGTSEYMSARRIRLVINHEQEIWHVPDCKKIKVEQATTVIMLDLPSAPPTLQGPGISLGDLLDCMKSAVMYPW